MRRFSITISAKNSLNSIRPLTLLRSAVIADDHAQKSGCRTPIASSRLIVSAFTLSLIFVFSSFGLPGCSSPSGNNGEPETGEPETGEPGTGEPGTGEPNPTDILPWDGCSEIEPWSCVSVGSTGPYGARSFEVHAAQNWVNTGVFLRRGQSAQVSATGSWKYDGFNEVDANGYPGQVSDHSQCPIGSLVARVGLYYKDENLECTNASTDTINIVAPKDGILYLGAFTGNDLGESYENRFGAQGSLSVTVQSDGATVPSVQGATSQTAPFEDVDSGWVEVVGTHVILTIPTATAILDRETLPNAVLRLDAIYEAHQRLRGAQPHSGQRIRFFPDETAPGWMLAGNPIRVKHDLVEGDESLRISRAGEPGFDPWGFAHELGHDFNHIRAVWTHQVDDSLEVWPNIFSVHAFEELSLPLPEQVVSCAERGTQHKIDGSYQDLRDDVFLWLCLFLELKETYGWDVYSRFYADLNQRSNAQVGNWSYVVDTLSAAANRDVSPLFSAWRIPLP